MSGRSEQIQALRKARPRDRFLRGSLIAVACLVLYSLVMGDFSFADIFSKQSQSRLATFWEYLSEKDEPGSPRDLIRVDLRSRALDATMTTLWLSIAAMFLAGLGAFVLSAFAARNLATAEPFIASQKPVTAAKRLAWGGVVWLTRGFLIIARAIPEYIWAFLLIGLFGLGAWPAVLALALHNLGILGRLGPKPSRTRHHRHQPPSGPRRLAQQNLPHRPRPQRAATLDRLLFLPLGDLRAGGCHPRNARRHLARVLHLQRGSTTRPLRCHALLHDARRRARVLRRPPVGTDPLASEESVLTLRQAFAIGRQRRLH